MNIGQSFQNIWGKKTRFRFGNAVVHVIMPSRKFAKELPTDYRVVEVKEMAISV